jgi:hypothetical protein
MAAEQAAEQAAKVPPLINPPDCETEDEANWLPRTLKTGDTLQYEFYDKDQLFSVSACGDELIKVSVVTDRGTVEYGLSAR